MYHIIYDLERKYLNLDDCQRQIKNLILKPHIPLRRMPGEDAFIPRVCVGETVEDCVTAIGVEEIFNRCFWNEGFALPLPGEKEAYPIIIIELSDNLKSQTPTEEQVPDVDATNERWLLEAAKPIRTEIVWLDAFSVEAYFDYDFDCYICSRLRPLEDTSGYNHPWLNGKGHSLAGSCWGILCKETA